MMQKECNGNFFFLLVHKNSYIKSQYDKKKKVKENVLIPIAMADILLLVIIFLLYGNFINFIKLQQLLYK